MAGLIKLRDYQQQGIDQLYSKLKQGNKKVIFVLQTGGGKSLTMVEISRQCLELGCRVAIVMRRRTLVGQMSGTLDKSGIDHGIYMANHRRYSPQKQMQVCSIDTLGARSIYPDADVIICDECFKGDYFVKTSIGFVSFESLYKMDDRPLAMSFNDLTKKWEFKKILNVFKNSKKEEIVKIVAGTSIIEATHNHKIMTGRGWVNACDIKVGDSVVQDKNTSRNVLELHGDEKDLFIGSYFGDGGVQMVGTNTYRLRIRHDKLSQGEYCYAKAEVFGSSAIERENKGYSRNMQVSFSTKCYYINTSNIFSWCVEEMSLKSLAIFIMDDGSRQSKKYGLTIHTENFTEEQIDIIIKKILELTGVMFLKRKTRKYTVIYCGKNDAIKVLSAVGCHFHESIRYKLDGVDGDLCLFDFKKNTNDNYLAVVKKVSIESIPSQHMFDIEVESNHNYVVSKSGGNGAGTLVHNCHDVRRTSSKYRELFEHYDGKTIIGFTATPFSDNSLWDDYICPISAQDLMEKGFLVPAKIWVPNLIDVSNVAIKSTGEYDENDLFAACAESKVVGNIVEDWKKIGRGRRTILFAVNIEHSKLMADAFNKAGIPAMHCDANTKESDRNIALSSLKDGSIKILCNVNIFSTGLDLVEIECIIFARPTRSVIYYLQAVGRGLRPAPHIGKKDCIIIDNAGNALRFGSPYKSRPVDMSRKKEIEKSVEDDVAIRTCKQCFFVFDAKENKCPECGFQNPKIEREIKTEDGELVEYQLSEEEIAIIRKKEFQADFHKLKWVARTRIYKHVKDSEGKELKWVCKKLAEKYGIDFCKENEKLLTGSQR